MKSTGFIIGRFQAARMPDAFRNAIVNVKGRHSRVIIVLLQSPLPGTANNPLSPGARKKMIHLHFPEVDIKPLKDHPLREEWSANLDELIAGCDSAGEITLYGSADVLQQYTGTHTTENLNGLDSAESLPEEDPGDEAFRRGVVFAHGSSYPKVYATVDVALFRNGRKELLLGKKSLDCKWRLIGGFSDPGDESFEKAAARELREECGDIRFGMMVYEGSFRIDDWRYRVEKDKIITTLFSADLISGVPEASDDIADLDWFSLEELAAMITNGKAAAEHQPLFTHLLNKYKGM